MERRVADGEDYLNLLTNSFPRALTGEDGYLTLLLDIRARNALDEAAPGIRSVRRVLLGGPKKHQAETVRAGDQGRSPMFPDPEPLGGCSPDSHSALGPLPLRTVIDCSMSYDRRRSGEPTVQVAGGVPCTLQSTFVAIAGLTRSECEVSAASTFWSGRTTVGRPRFWSASSCFVRQAIRTFCLPSSRDAVSGVTRRTGIPSRSLTSTVCFRDMTC